MIAGDKPWYKPRKPSFLTMLIATLKVFVASAAVVVEEAWSWSLVLVMSMGKVAVSATMAEREVSRIFLWVGSWTWVDFMVDHSNHQNSPF